MIRSNRSWLFLCWYLFWYFMIISAGKLSGMWSFQRPNGWFGAAWSFGHGSCSKHASTSTIAWDLSWVEYWQRWRSQTSEARTTNHVWGRQKAQWQCLWYGSLSSWLSFATECFVASSFLRSILSGEIFSFLTIYDRFGAFIYWSFLIISDSRWSTSSNFPWCLGSFARMCHHGSSQVVASCCKAAR